MASRIQNARPRRRIRRRILACLTILQASSFSPVSGFSLQNFASQSTRCLETNARTPIPAIFSSSSSEFGVSETSLEHLDDLTVKELKQIIIDNQLDQERGIWSRLKRKQDMIDYLRQNCNKLDDELYDDDLDEDEDDDNDETSSSPPVGIELSEGDFSIIDDDIDDDDEEGSSSPPVGIELAGGDFSIVYDDDDDAGAVEPTKTNSVSPNLQLSQDIASMIPTVVQEKMASRGITSLLPIQQASFERICKGKDAIIQSPTGSGKTLAFVPILSTF